MESRLGRSRPPPLDPHARRDVRVPEDPRERLADPPSLRSVHFGYLRHDRPGRANVRRFDESLSKRLVNGDRNDPLAVATCLLRHKLDDPLLQVDLRPIQPAAIPQPQTRVDADEEERSPFADPAALAQRTLPRRLKQPTKLIHRQLPARMTIIRPEAHALPGIFLKTGVDGENPEDLAQHAHAIVVARSAEIGSQTGKVFGYDLPRYVAKIADFKVIFLHPSREVHPNQPLGRHRRGGEVVPQGRLDVFKPNVGKRKLPFAPTKRHEEALQKTLRLVPVGCARGASVALALDADPHRPTTAFLALQVSHALFPCHQFVLSYVVIEEATIIPDFSILHSPFYIPYCTLLHIFCTIRSTRLRFFLEKSAECSIVGYLTMPISGYKMATPCFKNLGTENYPIDNFTVQGATDALTSIQVLNELGGVKGTYYWYNAFGDYPAGWFLMGGLDPANVELKPGEAVFFYTDESGVTIQSCGQVPGEITNDVAGYKMLGNGSPVTIDIDKVEVKGATDALTSIQVLNELGGVKGTYYWYNAFGDYPAGWFLMGGLDPAGISLEPGDAVLFYSDEQGVTATVLAAL